MSNKIDLKDFSINEIENKTLYKLVEANSTLIIDSAICEVIGENKEVKPILEIHKLPQENKVKIITFSFIGKFSYKKIEFNITSRFNDFLLERMITFVNDFDINTLEYEAKYSKEKNNNLAMKILYLNFIFNLEKLSILGLPKSYEKVENRSYNLKGQVDFNCFIKKDLPFNGKISSKYYEQKISQEILDVLYTALEIVKKNMSFLVNSRIMQMKNFIETYANKQIVNELTLQKALNHKSLQNSLYKEFKSLLKIASYIIRYTHSQNYKANNILNGLILDVSLLWEKYVYKLLKKHFKDDWDVMYEKELVVYKDNFFTRKIIPDIVMQKDNKVMVFDAKYKKMNFNSKNNFDIGDVNRCDFFQIHTYISYYQNMGYNVIAGGLLYPMETKYDKNKCFSDNLFGNIKIKFIVDGIELFELKEGNDISKFEQEFLKRIEELIY